MKNGTTTEKGKRAENEALEILSGRKNWKFLRRNFRWRGGEIDLIFEETLSSGCIDLVFIEVRSRAPNAMVTAAESVNWRKRVKLRLTAQVFLSRYEGPAQAIRMDVMAKDGESWTHHREAW